MIRTWLQLVIIAVALFAFGALAQEQTPQQPPGGQQEQPAAPAQEQPSEPAGQQPAEPAEPAQQQPAEPAQQPASPAQQQPAEPAEPAQQQPAEPAEPAQQQPAEPAQEPAEPAQQQPAEPAEQQPAGQEAGQAGQQGEMSADQLFVTAAAHSNMFELEASRLALENATTPEVQQFAQQMIDAHTAASEQLNEVAGTLGLQLPQGLSAEQQFSLQYLMQLEGEAFEQRYLEGQFIAHQGAIALFRMESEAAEDDALGEFATSTLPTLEEHLGTARDLLDQMVGAEGETGDQQEGQDQTGDQQEGQDQTGDQQEGQQQPGDQQDGQQQPGDQQDGQDQQQPGGAEGEGQ
jgi:predicted outer membrane protein